MKIAYYLPSLQAPGGIERIVTFKANYFAEHFEGYDITIITSEQMGKAHSLDRKSTRLNSSHTDSSRMPSSA